MNDLERRLEAALRRGAEGAAQPRPLTSKDLTRVRLAHALAGALFALVVLGGVVAVMTLTRPNPAPQPPAVRALPARVGPYTHRLYVVDARPPSRLDAGSSAVMAAIPRGSALEVVRTIDVGLQAETALSPDGRLLYSLAFLPDSPNRDGRQTLATYDTSSGRRVNEAPIETLLPQDWATEQWQATCCTGLFSSPEGGRLYFAERSYTKHQAHDSIWVGTFDTVEQKLLPEAAEIAGCDQRAMVPVERGTVVVVCTHTACCTEAYSETNDVRWVTIAEDGSTAESHVVPLTSPSSDGSSTDDSGELAWAVPSPDRRWIYAVTRVGRLFVIDVQEKRVAQVVDLDLTGSFEVAGEKVALSPDGGTLYVGTSDTTLITHDLADSIQGFDVATWRRTGHVRVGAPFYSLSFGPAKDGRLYAMSPAGPRASKAPRKSTIEVFDPTTLEQVATVARPFGSPVLGMVPLLDGR
jgi:WD40 repeat protein